MGKLFASWIHGSSVRAQRHDENHLWETAYGFGTNYWSKRPPTSSWSGFTDPDRRKDNDWFHFAIPTPVIVDGRRARLKRFFVFYDTVNDTKITSVHAFDGKKKIPGLVFDGLSLSGGHSDGLDGSNTWTVSKKTEMRFGLGISVHVEFEWDEGYANQPEIAFIAAGADFETD